MRVFVGADLPDRHVEQVRRLVPATHEVQGARAVGYEKLNPEELVTQLSRDGFPVVVTNDRAVKTLVEKHTLPITVLRYRGKDDAVDFKGQFREAERRNREVRKDVTTHVVGALNPEQRPSRDIEPGPMKHRP
jgi:hypothetical protein